MARPEEQVFVSLLLDENVAERLGTALRQYGYVAQSAREAGYKGRGDTELLEYVAGNRMAILSHNIADFAKLHEQWLLEGRQHHGIILTGTSELKPLLKKVLQLLDRLTAGELLNQRRFI